MGLVHLPSQYYSFMLIASILHVFSRQLPLPLLHLHFSYSICLLFITSFVCKTFSAIEKCPFVIIIMCHITHSPGLYSWTQTKLCMGTGPEVGGPHSLCTLERRIGRVQSDNCFILWWQCFGKNWVVSLWNYLLWSGLKIPFPLFFSLLSCFWFTFSLCLPFSWLTSSAFLCLSFETCLKRNSIPRVKMERCYN